MKSGLRYSNFGVHCQKTKKFFENVVPKVSRFQSERVSEVPYDDKCLNSDYLIHTKNAKHIGVVLLGTAWT